MDKDSIVIVSATRTPQGNLLGIFKDVTAVTLGATVIQSAVTKASLIPHDIDEVIMGCV